MGNKIQSNPINTDTKRATESVCIKVVSVKRGLT